MNPAGTTEVRMSTKKMRTRKDIEETLALFLGNECLNLPRATIEENAPLALTQLEYETIVRTLRWVLMEKLGGK